MIENRLSIGEFSNFLSPIIALKNLNDSMRSIEEVFDIKISHVDDLYSYLNKYRVQFEGFRFHIRDIKKNPEGQIHIHIQLRIEDKWWFNYFPPEKKVIKTIQEICKKVIHNLKFSTYKRLYQDEQNFETKSYLQKYYYDSKAFSQTISEDGIALSPLIIGASTNGQYRFVEFNFCALSYEKIDGNVALKDNWKEFLFY